jgi:multicomponent Na+:H+ antiporter subunit G
VKETIATVLLVAGVAIEVLACMGVLAMRDTLDRLHFASASTAATLCVAAAVLVREGPSLIGVKAIVLAAFVLVSSPVLVHLTARTIHEGER